MRVLSLNIYIVSVIILNDFFLFRDAENQEKNPIFMEIIY